MAKSLKKSEFTILATDSYIVGTPAATTITYGDALSASIISGITGTSAVGELSAAIDGIFAFTSASYIPDATAGSLYEITFTPTLSDFNVATIDVSVVVDQAATTIVSLPIASDIVLGEALSGSTLSGGEAIPSGVFSFRTPSYAPTAVGIESVEVTFIPTDVNYAPVTTAVDINVLSEITFTGVPSATINNTVLLTADATGYGEEVDNYVSSFGTILSTGAFSWTPTTFGTFSLLVSALSGSDLITTGAIDILVKLSDLASDEQVAMLVEYDCSI